MLYTALRCVDSLKTLITPFLPFTSQKLHELLGYDGYLAGPLLFREYTEADGSTHSRADRRLRDLGRALGAGELPLGQRLLEPRPLFRKLDPERTVAEEHERMQRVAVAEAPGPAGHE